MAVDVGGLRELLEGATRGPWVVGGFDADRGGSWIDPTPYLREPLRNGSWHVALASTAGEDGWTGLLPEDAELIVALRNAAPALLDRIEELTAALRECFEESESRGLLLPALRNRTRALLGDNQETP